MRTRDMDINGPESQHHDCSKVEKDDKAKEGAYWDRIPVRVKGKVLQDEIAVVLNTRWVGCGIARWTVVEFSREFVGYQGCESIELLKKDVSLVVIVLKAEYSQRMQPT